MIPKAPHHYSRSPHSSEQGGDSFHRKRENSYLSQAAEIWGAVIAGVIVAGGAAYSANQQKKSAEQANATMTSGARTVSKLPFPELVDANKAQLGALKANLGALNADFDLANQVNNFQLGQALRGYTRVQPFFKQLQAQIGENALSFSRGELPSDVVDSIGRAAAERGFKNGIGSGANGAGAGTALGSLNLRNLGLTSLDLSQKGTDLAMRANQQAGALAPPLFDLSSMFQTPGMAFGAQVQNANTINEWNRANAGIETTNVGSQNALLGQTTQNTFAADQAAVKAYASAAGSLAGVANSAFQGSGTSNNFYPTAAAAQSNIGQYGGTPSYSQYGYAIRPQLV